VFTAILKVCRLLGCYKPKLSNHARQQLAIEGASNTLVLSPTTSSITPFASDPITFSEATALLPHSPSHNRAYKITVNTIAIIPSILAAFPPAVGNAVLATKALAALFGDKNNNFLARWEKICSGQYGQIPLNAILILAAYLAKAPFNSFNVFNSSRAMLEAIRCGKKVHEQEKELLAKIFNVLDKLITISLLPLIGIAIGRIVQTGLDEMKVPPNWQGVGFAMSVIFGGHPLVFALEKLLVNEVPRTVYTIYTLKTCVCKQEPGANDIQALSKINAVRGNLMMLVYICLETVSLLNRRELPADLADGNIPLEELLVRLSQLKVRKCESPRAYARGITCFGLCPPEFSLLNSGILHPPANAGGFK